jgi:ribosomal protein L37E
MIDWERVRAGCPQCGNRVYWHSLSVWCLRCGWGRNWAAR